MIVRSNGTVTYVGKDMAYQFWKSGLLGHDFLYRRFAHAAERRHAVGDDERPGAGGRRTSAFGAAAATYNVIDVRQSYLQKLLKQALVAVGHPAEAERLTHFSYEMVALSHATAQELGFAPPPDSDDAKRPFVEVSGRKGLGVKADDLIDRVIEKALAEVSSRQAELPDAEQRRLAEHIGVAAVRYFLIKYSRTKVIAFDIDEALSFEGESGPYLQYAVVRANNIFQKLQERLGVDRDTVLGELPDCGSGGAQRRRRRPRALGAGARSRHGWTTSSSRSSAPSSSPCWRSTASAWRSSSTPSTTGRRSSTKSAPTSGAGARQASNTSGSNSPGCWT